MQQTVKSECFWTKKTKSVTFRGQKTVKNELGSEMGAKNAKKVRI